MSMTVLCNGIAHTPFLMAHIMYEIVQSVLVTHLVFLIAHMDILGFSQ